MHDPKDTEFSVNRRALGSLLGAAVALGAATDAKAQSTAHEATSPNGRLGLKVWCDGDGRISYSVSRDGKPLIAASRLGFILTDQPKLDRNFEIVSAAHSSEDSTWEQPWGESRLVRNHYNSLVIGAVQKRYDNRFMQIVFRLFDDGFGFRYEFAAPDTFKSLGMSGLKTLNIVDELTEFDVVPTATALWEVAGEWNRYEYLYQKTPLKELSVAHTPVTLKTDDGFYMAFHEAALVDYASMWLRRVDGQKLKARLAPSSYGPSVTREAPFTTPWRTVIVADTVTELYGSNLVLNLNDPNVLGDVSYFQPQKYIGIWWEMHLGKSTWEAGPRHGATTANTMRYMDFAAKHGFKGVLVEGWNKGWEDWFATGYDFKFAEAYPDFDIAAISAYGRKKGVALVGHHETGGNAAVYGPQLDAAFALCQKSGIHVVKTGYVADAGGAQVFDAKGQKHFNFHDSQDMARHHLKVVTTAHKYQVAINPHEPIKDTGLRRTYPNWVSREGARGMEYNAWGSPPNPPEHEVNLVYTRLLAGPMDYTPGVLSLQGQNQPIAATQARQLALYIAIYSPIQMAADLPENYEKHPKPFQFIKDLAVDWEASHLLQGEIGDFAVFARKDRHSEDWFIGAITDENARDISLPLSFLDPAKSYRAEIYRDGPSADMVGDARFDIVIESKTVTASDSLSARLARGGGLAVRFTPLKPSKNMKKSKKKNV